MTHLALSRSLLSSIGGSSFVGPLDENRLEAGECPLGHRDGGVPVYKLGRGFSVLTCVHCGAAYLTPRLRESEMIKIYSNDSYFDSPEFGYRSYISQEDSLRATVRNLVKSLKQRGVSAKRLLDLGCGYGYFLDEARPLALSRFGSDYSSAAVEQARKIADHIWLGGVDQIESGERFDLLTLIQVIEHIYNPVDFLKRCYNRIEPGGRILLATPNFGTSLRKIMRSRWPSFKVPEHISYFDQASLTNLLVTSGFSEPEIVPYPHAFPLSLIMEKFGIQLPDVIGRFSIWVPGTTVCAIARA